MAASLMSEPLPALPAVFDEFCSRLAALGSVSFSPQRSLMLCFGSALLQGDWLDLDDMEALDPENYAFCASFFRSCVVSGLGENDRASWALRLKFLDTDLGVILERDYGWRGK